jgi:hypothetical protein
VQRGVFFRFKTGEGRIMKRIIATGISVFSALIILVSVYAKPISENGEPSRLGVTGPMVFVVTATAPFVDKAAIQPGDLIIELSFPQQENSQEQANACDLLSDLNALRNAVANTKPGSDVQIDLLRPNAAGDLEKHSVSLKTSPDPALKSTSTLGVAGRIGLMINRIDPSTPQAGLNLGDILVSARPFGEIVDLKAFRETVKQSKTGSSVDFEVLRLNSFHDRFESQTVKLTLYPYPEVLQGKTKVIESGKTNSFAATGKNQGGVVRVIPACGVAQGVVLTHGRRSVVTSIVRREYFSVSQRRPEGVETSSSVCDFVTLTQVVRRIDQKTLSDCGHSSNLGTQRLRRVSTAGSQIGRRSLEAVPATFSLAKSCSSLNKKENFASLG